MCISTEHTQEWVAAKKDPASDKYLTFVNIAVFVICASMHSLSNAPNVQQMCNIIVKM